MSVAPELAPDVVIPQRARRTSRGARIACDIDGNVLTPSAFRLPPGAVSEAEADALAAFDRPRRLWIVAPPTPWSATSLHRSRPPASGKTRIRPAPAATVAVPPTVGLLVTTRGRVLLAAAAAVVALAIALGGWLSTRSIPSAPAAPVPAELVVHDGDTLWSLAGQVDPGHDPRQVVGRLRDLNRLTSPDLVPGQVLRTK